jgi:hypothetical protein
MDAEVGEGGDGAAETGDHERFARKANWEWPVGQFTALTDRHPG